MYVLVIYKFYKYLIKTGMDKFKFWICSALKGKLFN